MAEKADTDATWLPHLASMSEMYGNQVPLSGPDWVHVH